MITECNIIQEIKVGGQKTVHLAEHPQIGKVVIKKGVIKSFTSLERIKREVEILSKLDSKYYPKQHHFNIDFKANTFEIVEDYIEGRELRAAMKDFRDPRTILALINSIVTGLALIWDKNIVHRDLKPENIIIRPDNTACIIDLGIARFLDLDSLTQSISPFGPCTPFYAAPEQLTNKKSLIDHRTDFYSLGLIALELYLGVHPFDPLHLGNKYSIVENIMQNIYLLETKSVGKNQIITEFVSKTLQIQPYKRFRSYQILQDFIAKNI